MDMSQSQSTVPQGTGRALLHAYGQALLYVRIGQLLTALQESEIMPKPFEGEPHKFFIPLLGSLVAFGPMSIDMYLPALPAIAKDLGASQAQMQHSLSAFFFGFCIAMLIYGPISDVIGRRKLLIAGLMIFVCSSFTLAFAPNAELFVFLRFTQAFGSAAAIVMARAIARDCYHPKTLPRVMSLMTLVTMVAPLAAPIIGGYVLYFASWRAIFITLTIIGLLAFCIIIFVLPETLRETEDDKGIILTSFKNYITLIKSPSDMGIIGVFAFSFGAMFAFIAGSPFVYIEYFKVPEQYYGYLFLLNVLGMIAMLVLNMKLLKKYKLRKIILFQTSFQLISGILLFIFNESNLTTIVVCIVLFISMTNALGANSLSLLLSQRGEMAGSATSLAVSSQFALGCLASYLVSILQDDTPFAMTLIMLILAFISFIHQFMIRRDTPDEKQTN